MLIMTNWSARYLIVDSCAKSRLARPPPVVLRLEQKDMHHCEDNTVRMTGPRPYTPPLSQHLVFRVAGPHLHYLSVLALRCRSRFWPRT